MAFASINTLENSEINKLPIFYYYYQSNETKKTLEELSHVHLRQRDQKILIGNQKFVPKSSELLKNL